MNSIETTPRTFGETFEGLTPEERVEREYEIAKRCLSQPAAVINWRLGFRRPNALAQREICKYLKETVIFPLRNQDANETNN